MHRCCPLSNDAAALTTAAHCFLRERPQPACVYEASSAAEALVLGVGSCARGFFVLSRNAAGLPVCTGGDSYHLAATEEAGRCRFSALSQSLDVIAHDAGVAYAYFVPTNAALVAGKYTLRLSLVSTQRRDHQHLEGRGALSWSRSGGEEPLRHWLRDRRCSWSDVAQGSQTVSLAPPSFSPSRKRCRSMPPLNELAYVRLDEPSVIGGCGRWCHGNATASLIDTSNEPRWQGRARRGFQHALAATNCYFELFDEAAVTQCLAGRSLHLMGSAAAVDLQRGMARINRTIAAWTRVRPGKVHPNVADFWRAYEKPGGTYCFARGKCGIRFGSANVLTTLIHHPHFNGLANLFPGPAPPQIPLDRVNRGAQVQQPVGGDAVARKTARQPSTAAEKRASAQATKRASAIMGGMCDRELLVFESGLHDFALPNPRLAQAISKRHVTESRTSSTYDKRMVQSCSTLHAQCTCATLSATRTAGRNLCDALIRTQRLPHKGKASVSRARAITRTTLTSVVSMLYPCGAGGMRRPL